MILMAEPDILYNLGALRAAHELGAQFGHAILAAAKRRARADGRSVADARDVADITLEDVLDLCKEIRTTWGEGHDGR
jgi:hypothetical protein